MIKRTSGRMIGLILIGTAMQVASPNLSALQPNSNRRQSDQAEESITWKTGGLFREALNSKIRYSSSSQLKADLTGLSQASRVAIFLDRSIDPNQIVEFPDQLLPLGEILDRVAESVDATAVHVGSIVYIAPVEKALRLLVVSRIVEQLVDRLPDEVASKLSEAVPLSWPFLTNPQDPILLIAADVGLGVSGQDALVHDLWGKADLPRFARWEQLTFLLNSMDCSWSVTADRQQLKIFRLTNAKLVVPYPRSQRSRVQKELRDLQLPDMQVATKDDQVLVRGLLNQQIKLMARLRPQHKWSTRPPRPGAEDRFALKTRAKRGSILASIAKNREVELVFAADVRAALDEPVSLDVRQLSIEKLIAKVLEGTGLDFRLNKNKLEIFR